MRLGAAYLAAADGAMRASRQMSCVNEGHVRGFLELLQKERGEAGKCALSQVREVMDYSERGGQICAQVTAAEHGALTPPTKGIAALRSLFLPPGSLQQLWIGSGMRRAVSGAVSGAVQQPAAFCTARSEGRNGKVLMLGERLRRADLWENSPHAAHHGSSSAQMGCA